jgi:S1-C subfamily serine protease
MFTRSGRRWLLASFIAMLAAPAAAQVSSTPPPVAGPAVADDSPLPPDALEHWRRSTIAIGEWVNNQFVTIGSGVVVTVDGHTACILTAAHVFFEPQKGWTPTSVRLRVPQDSVVTDEDQGVVVTLNEGDKTYWKQADSSDIAIIKAPVEFYQYSWDVHAVYISEFGSAQDIFQGANVLTLGYPMIPGPEYLHTPIARGGIIAWWIR